MCIKFRILEKKDEFPSLIICEIIVSEIECYWNDWKVLLENTIL